MKATVKSCRTYVLCPSGIAQVHADDTADYVETFVWSFVSVAHENNKL